MTPLGIRALARLQWRTNWRTLLTPLLLTGLVTAIGAGVSGLYPTAAHRATYAATLGSSLATQAINGRAYDLTSIGGITAYEVGFMGQLLLPLVGVLLAIHLTRRWEDTGTTELLTAAPLHRLALPLAAALNLTGAWLLFAATAAVGLHLLGLPLAPATHYTLSLGAFALAWSGVGLVAAQLAAPARAARGLGLAAAATCYLLRLVVDGSAWSATWLSPMGWVVEARSWGPARWTPILALLALAAAGLAAALALAQHRDLGVGALPTRLGPATGRQLAHPLRLHWRLARHLTWGWLGGATAWAATLGLLSQEFLAAFEGNPTLAALVGGAGPRLVSQFGLLVTSLCAAAAGLAAFLPLGGHETAGRLGLLLAGSRSRRAWWTSTCLSSLTTVCLVHLTAATVLGLSQWQALGQATAFSDTLRAAVTYLPAVSVPVGGGALLVGCWPRARALAWLPVAWILVVGLLAQPLRLPQWAIHLSPLAASGNLPTQPAHWPTVAGLAVLTVGLLVLGGVGLARRDLRHG
ncbi:ABC transporter [Buchananella hordeovulneris]|uniref:ABC transporter n=1 Tax=Buchananella hordeovulneris TaxID=52770 RepID=UPI0026DC37BD|nr:ABC transporter [Buchananella hordeovulneris]MDO5080766.1 ABC transporter [Buchananella hordeovulneris]